TGNVTSTNGGTGNTASANLTVATPPSITKAFGAASIPLNGTTSLTFTIQNPNASLALTGIAFTDNLPAGLVVASTPNLNNTCGGTATAVGGSGSVSLSAGTLAASTSCTVSVSVQGVTPGVKNNSVTATSAEAGTGNTSNASLTVTAPPTIVKAFGAASIPLNGSTSLSFTIQNTNTTTALSGVGFSDSLPAGLVISTPNGLTGSCGTGTITATAGTNGIALIAGTLAANGSCTFSVNVTGIAAGTQNNTTSNVSSTEGGTGGPASASINVVAPPSIAKVFNPANIALNATTSLSFTITNPAANAVALAGVAFSDTLPTGLTVANASATVCGGTLTTTAPNGIALSGATTAANGQCQFSVTVTGAAAGQFTNTTGNVSSANGGTGNTASANLSVASAPTITKAFGAASILLNANTSLTFSINNPNTIGLTGLAFSDSLPAGLVVATPNGLTNTCGGAASAAAGSSSVILSGGTLAASGSCSITLNITGIAAGVQNNTTGPISSDQSGAGATSNTASITVVAPPSITKAFGAASINLNATTTLGFIITNPNPTVALTGLGFADTLPAGLQVATPNGLAGSCGSGSITASGSAVNLSGGSIAAGGSCTFSVNVVGTTGGHKVNTTGTLSSANAGSGNQATASMDVLAPDLTISKTHLGTFTRGQTGAQWVMTVSNVGFGPTSGTVTMIDTLPSVQNPPVPTDISGAGWTCTLATVTCTRGDALPSGTSYPPITLTVNIPQNIQDNFTNTAAVSGGGDVNPNNNTATDTISLAPRFLLTPQSGTVTVTHGGVGQMVIKVDAPDPTLGKITFSCSGLPSRSACAFNPVSIDTAVTAGPTNVTVFIGTAQGSASLLAPQRPGRAGHAPVYAMLSLPVFGMMLAGFGGQRRKGEKRWAALVLLGLLCMLAMTGCGAASFQPPPLPGTPAGTYAVTVTATGNGTSATASFNLVV
ncbi:MAG: beta strand repeat-containing protein, partial [Candidatus Angelobacter sp.]